VSIYVALGFYKSKLNSWTLVFCALAFVFNPIFPAYLSKESWVSIDLICSLLFFVAAYSNKQKYVQ